MESAVAVCKAICTKGYLSLKILHIFAKSSTMENSPQPTVTVPAISSSCPFSSSSVRSLRSIISRALRLNKIPASVNVMFLPERTNKGTPISSSKAAICLERVG